MNPLDTSWVFLKTMPPGERARVQSMERRGLKPEPKNIFGANKNPAAALQPVPHAPESMNWNSQSPNDYIDNIREMERLQRRQEGVPQVAESDFDSVFNPAQVGVSAPSHTQLQQTDAPQPTPERVGPGDMTPDAIMRYTKPQLAQMMQLIHNELTRRQDNKNMGKVAVR